MANCCAAFASMSAGPAAIQRLGAGLERHEGVPRRNQFGVADRGRSARAPPTERQTGYGAAPRRPACRQPFRYRSGVGQRWRTLDSTFGSLVPDEIVHVVQMDDLTVGRTWVRLMGGRRARGLGRPPAVEACQAPPEGTMRAPGHRLAALLAVAVMAAGSPVVSQASAAPRAPRRLRWRCRRSSRERSRSTGT